MKATNKEIAETGQIFEGAYRPLSEVDARSMLTALKNPALVYVLEDGSCLIQGHCSRLLSNHRFFKKFTGSLPENISQTYLLEPDAETASS